MRPKWFEKLLLRLLSLQEGEYIILLTVTQDGGLSWRISTLGKTERP